MVMAENEVIHILLFCEFTCKLIQRLLFTLEFIRNIVCEPVAARPSVPETEGQPRVEHAEQELGDAAVEHAAEEPVSERDRAETVAMAQAELLSSDLDQSRLGQLDHPQFLEVGICPDVMVAFKKKHFDTLVHQVLKGSEDADIPLWHDITVFVPEIPDVPKEVQSLGIFRKGAKKIHETPLPAGGIADLKAEMDIGDEICTTALFHIMVKDPSLSSG